MATSGTVSTVSYPVGSIIDHGFRRAGYEVQKMAAEQVDLSIELLWTLLSELSNTGFPLWTRQFLLLGVTAGSPNVSCPVGTVDVITPFWRTLAPYRGPATTSTGADASALFGGQANSDVVIAGPNPSVAVSFGTATQVDTVGVLLGGAAGVTAALNLQTSSDGVTYTTAQTLPSTAYAPGAWQYFDLDPSLSAAFLRIQMAGANPWTLNQLNFGVSPSSTIPLGGGGGASLNIDDYFQLPDRSQQGDRPNSAYVDRLFNAPVIKLYPVPNLSAFYGGVVGALVRRYIQDPGKMTDTLEIPQRWIEAIQWQLAKAMMDELPPPRVDPSLGLAAGLVLQERTQRYQRVLANMTRSMALAWSEERTRGPISLLPNIAPYTR